jgi:transcriptional regulator with XRE-family HTH domain
MELAERIGIHFTFVSSVERGEQNVSLHSLLKLADGLDLNPAVLVNQTFSSPICQSSVECGGSYSVTQGPLVVRGTGDMDRRNDRALIQSREGILQSVQWALTQAPLGSGLWWSAGDCQRAS